MKIKILFPNEKGKIELSKEELEVLLEESYQEGFEEGKNSKPVYYPYINTTGNITYKGSHDDFWNSPSSVTAHMSSLEGAKCSHE